MVILVQKREKDGPFLGLGVLEASSSLLTQRHRSLSGSSAEYTRPSAWNCGLLVRGRHSRSSWPPAPRLIREVNTGS